MELQKKWLSIVSEWEESGKSRREFCREQGHKFSTFGYWRKQYLLADTPRGKATFVPLEPLAPALEVIYPNGVRLQVPKGTSR